MAIWTPTTNSKNTEVENSNNTDMNTGKLDRIISDIAALKATPQTAERDAQIQYLTAKRNALLTENANCQGWY